MLKFLATEKSVYLIFIIAIDKNGSINTRLCSMFNQQLLTGTSIIKHWAERNSRGSTQYNGKAMEDIINLFNSNIDEQAAKLFLDKCLKDS